MRIYLNFYKYFLPYWKSFALALLLLIVYGVSSGSGLPIAMKKFLGGFFDQSVPYQKVVYVSALLPFFFILRGIFGYFGGILLAKCGLYTSLRMKEAVFKKVQSLPISYFSHNESGDILTRISIDTSAVQAFMIEASKGLLQYSITCVAAFSTLIYLTFQNKEALFVLLFFAIMPIFILPVLIIARNLKKRGRQFQEASAKISQRIIENLSAVEEIRSFNLEQKQSDDFIKKSIKAINVYLKILKYELLQQPSMEIIVSIVIAIAIVAAKMKNLPFETFAAMGIALYFAFDPLKNIIKIHNSASKTVGSAQRVLELLHSDWGVKDKEDAIVLEKPLSGNISIKDAFFAYNKDKVVLNNINLDIKKGQYVALVGHSGAGKSTLAKLLPRFYDLNEGQIFFDDLEIKDIKQSCLHDNIAVVSQSPFLFNESIFDNILLGKASASKEDVIKAAKDAFAYDFINDTLENGFDTIAGERGSNLSGGQRQRIALARAFLKDSPILILDEATSALDSESEYFIKLALDKLRQNRTVIAIAHRLSTIKNADKIIVMKDGKIISSGTHAELLEKSEEYKSIVEKQSL